MHKHGRLLWFVISLFFLVVPALAVARATQAFNTLKTSEAVSHLSVNAVAAITAQYLLVLYLGSLIAALAALSLLVCAITALKRQQ